MTHHKNDQWLAPIRKIQERICVEFGVTLIDLKSCRRPKPIIAPRHAAMWLCKKLTMASLPAIGKAFGDRDHTTIIHGVRNAEAMMVSDVALRDRISNIVREWGHEETAK